MRSALDCWTQRNERDRQQDIQTLSQPIFQTTNNQYTQAPKALRSAAPVASKSAFADTQTFKLRRATAAVGKCVRISSIIETMTGGASSPTKYDEHRCLPLLLTNQCTKAPPPQRSSRSAGRPPRKSRGGLAELSAKAIALDQYHAPADMVKNSFAFNDSTI